MKKSFVMGFTVTFMLLFISCERTKTANEQTAESVEADILFAQIHKQVIRMDIDRLSFTLRWESEEQIRNVINRRYKYELRPNHEITLLHEAIYYQPINDDEIPIIEKLISAGADVNARGYKSRTTLHTALLIDHIQLVKKLIESGADVNLQNDDLETPLLRAVKDKCKTEIVELLLNAGADRNIPDKDGKTPCDYAKESENSKIRALFNLAQQQAE